MINRATQTSLSQYGAELRFHLDGLSFRLSLLAVVAPLLCILNGCSYYIYWRPIFKHITAPPPAFYVTASGIFFQLFVLQLLIQQVLRTMIEQMSFRQREKRIRCCYLVLVFALLPSTVGQMLLYADNWFDTSRSYAAVFVTTVYVNILLSLCVLAYTWTSICVDWVQSRIKRALLEKRAKIRECWEKEFRDHTATAVFGS